MNGRGLGEIIRDEAIVAALAAGLSQEQAAKRAGTSSRTVRRRLQNPVFREWLEEAKKSPSDYPKVYTALQRALEAWNLVKDIAPLDWTDITTLEAKRLAEETVSWLDEWVYVLEEECAG